MNSQNTIKAVVLTIGLVLGGAAHAFVGMIAVSLGQMNNEGGELQTSFSADAKLETEEMTANTRIYYKPGKVRDEMDTGQMSIVTINRFDLNKVWTIMGQGMYMEFDSEADSEQVPTYELISRDVVGRETVNGMETTKYKSVYKSKDGKYGGFTWFTDDNIAVKGFMISETKGEKQRVLFEITNLQRGEQADSLFEIPPGYKNVNMGGLAGMGNLGQMGGAGAYGAPPAAAESAGADDEEASDDQGFTGEVADEAQQAAEQETKKGIRDSVSKGIGKLFGK